MSQADSFSNTPSPTPTPRSLTPYTNLPFRRADTRSIDGMEWLRIGHQANRRRGIASSAVWDHGDEYIKAADPESPASFICDHCDSVLAISGPTSNLFRHMRDRHRLKLENTRKRTLPPGLNVDSDDNPSSSSRALSIQPIPRPEFRSLYTNISLDAFRQSLIELAVVRQLSFATLTCPKFRKPFLLLQPSLEKYLVRSPQTIANWVYNEFKKVKD